MRRPKKANSTATIGKEKNIYITLAKHITPITKNGMSRVPMTIVIEKNVDF